MYGRQPQFRIRPQVRRQHCDEPTEIVRALPSWKAVSSFDASPQRVVVLVRVISKSVVSQGLARKISRFRHADDVSDWRDRETANVTI